MAREEAPMRQEKFKHVIENSEIISVVDGAGHSWEMIIEIVIIRSGVTLCIRKNQHDKPFAYENNQCTLLSS